MQIEVNDIIQMPEFEGVIKEFLNNKRFHERKSLEYGAKLYRCYSAGNISTYEISMTGEYVDEILITLICNLPGPVSTTYEICASINNQDIFYLGKTKADLREDLEDVFNSFLLNETKKKNKRKIKESGENRPINFIEDTLLDNGFEYKYIEEDTTAVYEKDDIELYVIKEPDGTFVNYILYIQGKEVYNGVKGLFVLKTIWQHYDTI